MIFTRAARSFFDDVTLTTGIGGGIEWTFGDARKKPVTVDVREREVTAMPAVHRCVGIIADTIAACPVRLEDSAGAHTTFPLLEAPSEWFDRNQFLSLILRQLLIKGNAYVYIERDGASRVKALHPLPHDSIDTELLLDRQGRTIGRTYLYHSDHGDTRIQPVDMLHFAGPNFDGVKGRSVVQAHRESLGVIVAAELYANTLFSSGMLADGVLSTDDELEPGEARELKRRFETELHGPLGMHRSMVLDAGLTYTPLQMMPADAQFLESRNYGVREIGRLFGVPLAFLSHASDQGYSLVKAAEGDQIELVHYSVKFWADRLAAAMTRALSPRGTSVKFLVNSLVKSDARTRSSAALMWRKSKVISINELRAIEDLPPSDNPEADDPLSELGSTNEGGRDDGANMGNDDTLGDGTQTGTEDEPPATQ